MQIEVQVYGSKAMVKSKGSKGSNAIFEFVL